ncbi:MULTISPECIES: hypothetical protein [unclassified Nocardia]|uniref:hypothetical protein n=1 Tax=unclassified Nocardia TaxID=2637762 RepID=UPI001CE3C6C8|nr:MULTISPECIES: hypothetical protein [unclassified Nocardia]
MKPSPFGAEVLRDIADRVATDPETASLQEIREVALIARNLLDEQIRAARPARSANGELCALIHELAWVPACPASQGCALNSLHRPRLAEGTESA